MLFHNHQSIHLIIKQPVRGIPIVFACPFKRDAFKPLN